MKLFKLRHFRLPNEKLVWHLIIIATKHFVIDMSDMWSVCYIKELNELDLGFISITLNKRS